MPVIDGITELLHELHFIVIQRPLFQGRKILDELLLI
jgi:hypothetical protein